MVLESVHFVELRAVILKLGLLVQRLYDFLLRLLSSSPPQLAISISVKMSDQAIGNIIREFDMSLALFIGIELLQGMRLK